MENDITEGGQIFGDFSEKLKTIKSEVEITPEVQAEYISYHDKIDPNRYEEDDAVKDGAKLFEESVSND